MEKPKLIPAPWMSLVFKTGLASPYHYHAELAKAGCYVPQYTGELFAYRQFVTTVKPIRIELGRSQISELGLTEGAELTTLYRHLYHHGLRLCPIDTGMQLGMIKETIHQDDRFTICSRPISDVPNGKISVFEMVHRLSEGSKGLYVTEGQAMGFFPPDTTIVYMIPPVGR